MQYTYVTFWFVRVPKGPCCACWKPRVSSKLKNRSSSEQRGCPVSEKGKKKNGGSCVEPAACRLTQVSSESPPGLLPPSFPFFPGVMRNPALDSAMKMRFSRTTWMGHAHLRCLPAVHPLVLEPAPVCSGLWAPNVVFLANDNVVINLLCFSPPS